MHRLSLSLPLALPASVTHQQVPTAIQAGTNNYHAVPITIAKEGRMSPRGRQGEAGEGRLWRVITAEGQSVTNRSLGQTVALGSPQPLD